LYKKLEEQHPVIQPYIPCQSTHSSILSLIRSSPTQSSNLRPCCVHWAGRNAVQQNTGTDRFAASLRTDTGNSPGPSRCFTLRELQQNVPSHPFLLTEIHDPPPFVFGKCCALSSLVRTSNNGTSVTLTLQ
jgi:hypothetical protein